MRLILASLLVVSLGGCASIVKGTTQTVSINTPGHTGAQCTLTSPEIGTRTVRTPATAVLSKSKHNVTVTCRKGCYRGTGIIASHTEVMTAGNVILGGVVGLGIDAATGAMNRYDDQAQIHMSRRAGC